MHAFEYHRIASRIEGVLARQPRVGIDSLVALALPVILDLSECRRGPSERGGAAMLRKSSADSGRGGEVTRGAGALEALGEGR